MCCGKNRQQLQMQTALRKGAPAQHGPSPVPVAPTAPSPSNGHQASPATIAALRAQFLTGSRRKFSLWDHARRAL